MGWPAGKPRTVENIEKITESNRSTAASKRERREAARAEILEIARACARGELTATEALPRAENALAMARMSMSAREGLQTAELWLSQVQQLAKEERAREAAPVAKVGEAAR